MAQNLNPPEQSLGAHFGQLIIFFCSFLLLLYPYWLLKLSFIELF